MYRYLVSVVGGLVLFFAHAHAQTNVVVFLADDLGYMDVTCNNSNTFYETPNIQRLSDTGMRFTNGYAANPVCSPTRYSIMTGRHPSRANVTNFFSGKRAGKFLPAEFQDVMPLSETTIAELLRPAGYATFFAGKWHLGPTDSYWPEHQGFDLNRGGHHRGGPYGGKKYFSPYGNPRLADGPDGEHLPDRLASEANQFIREHREGPFLVYLAFYSVHTPLMARTDLREKYQRKAAGLSVEEGDVFAEEEQCLPIDEPRQVRVIQNHATYAGMVEALDAAVGKVLQQLDALGIADRTAVVFTSDNGGLSTSEGLPTSNLPLRGGKGWLYEGGIREPFLIRWPKHTQPGSTCDVPVSSQDLFPTIAEMAGVAATQHARDGLSLVPLLCGAQSLPRRSLFWHYPHYSNQGGFPGAAVRQGDWKLIERFEDGRIHLFNLRQDPSEQQDLAAHHGERAAAMRADLHQWYEDVGARFLRAKPGGPSAWRP